MTKYSAIIVEDEELPRLSLKAKLDVYHLDILVVAMFDNCDDALVGIIKNKPQMLFLDINLPGKNALWLLEQLEKVMKLPHIIFTTVYTDAEYLLKAIKFSAIDYLNKPIDIGELSLAIEKVKNRLAEKIQVEVRPPVVVDEKKYVFKAFNAQLVLASHEVVYFQADGNYCLVKQLRGKPELVFERLGDVEQRLDSRIFIRTGRSLIINREYVHRLNTKEKVCELLTPFETISLSLSPRSFEKLAESLSGD